MDLRQEERANLLEEVSARWRGQLEAQLRTLNSSPPDTPPTEVRLGDLLLESIGYADDLVIFGHSPQDLQKRIDRLATYYDKWGLTVNLKKTKVMRLTGRGGVDKIRFKAVGLRPMREILSFRVGRYLRSLSLARLALPQALWAYYRREELRAWSGSAKKLVQPISPALSESEPDEVDFKTSDSKLRRGVRNREVNEWMGDWVNPVSITERRGGRQGR
uniref:Reverse transcriptase domain-containing protein n=1 Tax=Chromera velia CCMP2878 TaxID=1169474 RepID=A0A0G4I795_9ALVE|eukprot:Cvel_11606.t1-p1 / transcript=Cvel_11606.t1 / gene=Cvel_11606 / organism=Chromera_velia_CCMP2878 / gene_product=hypothetical protein / transcript_product=hypothetical protein / location=Cvel_scaffold734:67978-68958(-) / protein_length=217 / sequence_SO=supercontig / SO=protein_coding / is_pseudo=false